MTTNRAVGSFEVTLTPQKPEEGAPSDAPGRMLINKRFSGNLTGSSWGEMLSSVSSVQGSASYVAMERVTGSLAGREGGFVLVHRGFMRRGAPELSVTVAPDSGTGALTGLTGTMQINISPGRHDYVFDYALPPAS